MAAEHTAIEHAAEGAGKLDPFEHVVDATAFHGPLGWHWNLPEISFIPSLDKSFQAGHLVMGYQPTKFIVLQIAAGLLLLLIFVPLVKKIQRGEPVRGRFWNFWELLVVFIRDEVVRPTIGDPHEHQNGFGSLDHSDPGQHAKGQFDAGHDEPLKAANDFHNHPVHTHAMQGSSVDSHGAVNAVGGHPADKYLPIVWSLFFYILFCNLFGAIPFLGAATGSISVTAVLALFVFGVVVYTGMKASGAVGFWKSLVPSMDLPGPMAIILKPMIWVIELFGLLVKHFVLAVRLFANMMAGHTVLGVMLGFIGMVSASHWLLFGAVTAGSIAGQLFIGLLELFVAFLQAYVFAFLATLFISAAVHPH